MQHLLICAFPMRPAEPFSLYLRPAETISFLMRPVCSFEFESPVLDETFWRDKWDKARQDRDTLQRTWSAVVIFVLASKLIIFLWNLNGKMEFSSRTITLIEPSHFDDVEVGTIKERTSWKWENKIYPSSRFNTIQGVQYHQISYEEGVGLQSAAKCFYFFL